MTIRKHTLALLVVLGAGLATTAHAGYTDTSSALEDQIIARAFSHYTEGVVAWRASEPDRARREWDAAVDVFLNGVVPVYSSERLRVSYREMLDTIADYERGADAAGVELLQQVYAPAPEELLPAVRELAGELRFGGLAVNVNPEIQAFLHYFSRGRGRETARVGLTRSTSFRPQAERIFREEGVPVELVWLAQGESGWRSTALSPAGALGVWQFIPSTAQRFGLRQTAKLDERTDFVKATRAAARYLKFLADRYDGDWLLAVGAYNCGEGTMDRAIARNGGRRDFWSLKRRGLLPGETANYVPAVLATIVIASDPSRFELN